MPFCAGEKCKYEKVFQKLSDRLINVRIRKFAGILRVLPTLSKYRSVTAKVIIIIVLETAAYSKGR